MKPSDHLVSRAPAPVQRCAILSADGCYLSDGLAMFIVRDQAFEVRVTACSAPGAILTAHFGQGRRRYLLRLDSGIYRADLVSTAWEQPGRRLCVFLLDRDVAS